MPLKIDVLTEFDEDLIRREYLNQKPYVLKNVGSKWAAMKWDFESIKELCGSTAVWAYQYDRNSSLSYIMQAMLLRKRMTVSTFLNDYFQKGAAATWSLKECHEIFEDNPQMLKDVDFKSIFTGPTDIPAWTYFWIGNPDSSIGLHSDVCEFNNLYQIIGTKKWKFYPPHDKDNLYMETKTTVEGGLYSPLDVFKTVDLQKYPNYAKATEYEVIIGPGDILYVPSGWWHAVYSQTATMSVNYVCADEGSGGNGEWYQNMHSVAEAGRLIALAFLQQMILKLGIFAYLVLEVLRSGLSLGAGKLLSDPTRSSLNAGTTKQKEKTHN